MKQMATIVAPTRKSGIDSIVLFGLAAVLVFFLISGGVAYLNIQTLSEDNQRIIHSHQVIATLEGGMMLARAYQDTSAFDQAAAGLA